MLKLTILVACCALLLGCGSASNTCKPVGFQMVVTAQPGPTPDHTLQPPGNQEKFTAGLGSTYGPYCTSNQLYKATPAQWTTSDPTNVSISSADNATNGLATCLGATTATVTATLTAYGFTESRSAPITCK